MKKVFLFILGAILIVGGMYFAWHAGGGPTPKCTCALPIQLEVEATVYEIDPSSD